MSVLGARHDCWLYKELPLSMLYDYQISSMNPLIHFCLQGLHTLSHRYCGNDAENKLHNKKKQPHGTAGWYVTVPTTAALKLTGNYFTWADMLVNHAWCGCHLHGGCFKKLWRPSTWPRISVHLEEDGSSGPLDQHVFWKHHRNPWWKALPQNGFRPEIYFLAEVKCLPHLVHYLRTGRLRSLSLIMTCKWMLTL